MELQAQSNSDEFDRAREQFWVESRDAILWSLRIAYLGVAGMLLIFAVEDVVFYRPLLPWLWTERCITISGFVILALVTRTSWAAERVVPLAVLFPLWCQASVLYRATLIGQAWGPPSTAMVLTFSCAMLVPWKIRHQVITVAGSWAAVLLSAILIPGASVAQTMSALVLTAFSIVLSHSIGQRRLALWQAQQAQARLIGELDAYSRIVAHDLKNPIGVISGYVELLQMNVDDSLRAEDQKLMEGTLRGCDSMTRIVDELLLLARVRQDKVAVAPLAMATIIADVRDRLATAIATSQAQITTPETWPQAEGYAAWIEEVWTNYISNAIKYGGSPPKIELGASPNNGMVRFWVRDNGRGIAREDHDRLFREFSRLHAARSDSHGLGLSIVKRIIDKLGGKVGVDSAIGQGSEFWFTLPRASGREEWVSPI